MTPAQRKLARHALGLPNRRRRSYRNRFVVAYQPCRESDIWFAMLEGGLAENARPHKGQVRFWLTEKGARAALEPGETLCPEDFPTTHPRAQER